MYINYPTLTPIHKRGERKDVRKIDLPQTNNKFKTKINSAEELTKKKQTPFNLLVHGKKFLGTYWYVLVCRVGLGGGCAFLKPYQPRIKKNILVGSLIRDLFTFLFCAVSWLSSTFRSRSFAFREANDVASLMQIDSFFLIN